ncbi:hypothetical protein BAC2_03422 [uncultured bacterium]|nr:hypothetical protein [Sandaracinaceae bacterium]CAG1773026.1 hypothetical protein BAC2_03422 [uncultured bacterium]
MAEVVALCAGVGVVAIALCGFAVTLGLDRLRDSFARVAAAAIALTILIPYVARLLHRISCAAAIPVLPDLGVWTALFLLGHAGLLLAWLTTRLGPPGFIENIERGRGRSRERVTPALEQGDE